MNLKNLLAAVVVAVLLCAGVLAAGTGRATSSSQVDASSNVHYEAVTP
jgi:hypothetical protein